MSRKDRMRFQRLRETDPDYAGFRGLLNPTVRTPSSETGTVTCSICERKRNVAITSLPEDISEFVCLRCRQNEF